jgi:flagellar M-ring protein FliF
MGSFGQMATKLSPRGWLSAGAAGIGAIVILYLLLQMVSAPSYTTLLTGLEPAQTGKMTAALSQKGISYELQNNGTALAVQSNQTAQARVALAGAGLLEGNQQGFSLFDKSELGESTFQQQVTYQRALQGQLAQTIDQIQGVSGAQVELVLPNTQNQLFSENQAPPSAAVLLGGSGAL